MGCCLSRCNDKNEDERRPLLQDSIASGPNDNDSIKSVIPGKNAAEVWKEIIERATKSMINNSTTQPLHPIDIQERTKRYTKIISNLQTPLTATTVLYQQQQQQQDISNVLELLTDAKPYTDTVELSNHISKINYAVDQINASLVVRGHVVVYMKKLGRRI